MANEDGFAKNGSNGRPMKNQVTDLDNFFFLIDFTKDGNVFYFIF